MWRTWEDLKDNWGGLVNAANTAFKLAPHAKPGFWCDPDMLVVGSDLWRRKDIGEQRGSMEFDLPPHAPAFVKIAAEAVSAI